jgi:hypothetical protein
MMSPVMVTLAHPGQIGRASRITAKFAPHWAAPIRRMDLPDETEDLDLTLRHVTRRFPEQLAWALLPPGDGHHVGSLDGHSDHIASAPARPGARRALGIDPDDDS